LCWGSFLHPNLQTEAQAKAEVEALTEALNETIAVRDLATKADLEHLKVDLIKWIAGLLLAQIGGHCGFGEIVIKINYYGTVTV